MWALLPGEHMGCVSACPSLHVYLESQIDLSIPGEASGRKRLGQKSPFAVQHVSDWGSSMLGTCSGEKPNVRKGDAFNSPDKSHEIGITTIFHIKRSCKEGSHTFPQKTREREINTGKTAWLQILYF